MKSPHPFRTLAFLALLQLPVLAGDAMKDMSPKDMGAIDAPQADETPVAQEFSVSDSYTGGAGFKQGNAPVGNVSENYSAFNYVASPAIRDGLLLRIGVTGENFSFGTPSNSPVPNTLQSAALVIGADYAASDKILLRLEAHPGIYGDLSHIEGGAFNVPVQFGGTYLYSKDLQFILGFQYDAFSSTPFIGAPGVRWQFADKWVLSAIPPNPRLEYELNKAVTLFVGAEIIDSTFRVGPNFGATHGGSGPSTNHTLNNALLDYSEYRVGGGAEIHFMPGLTLNVAGGYVPYRDFDFHRADTSFHSWSGAPYAEVGLSGSF